MDELLVNVDEARQSRSRFTAAIPNPGSHLASFESNPRCK
jgi:hypothetical protein